LVELHIKRGKRIKTYYRALTIAGSDSGGGAGIQADLKTFSALGCYGMSVITALTAQNTVEIKGVYPVPPEFIADQIDAVVGGMGTDAVKIGMLHSREVIETVADRLMHHNCSHIVLDPVMIAKSGDKLLREDAIAALRVKLFTLAHIITPNLPEASVLLKREITTVEEMPRAARELAEMGCCNVLLKGGHLSMDQTMDLLYMGEKGIIVKFDGKRVNTRNSHGTGCTLSSAIAANLAKGQALSFAVKNAKEYITNALIEGANFRIGFGHGPACGIIPGL